VEKLTVNPHNPPRPASTWQRHRGRPAPLLSTAGWRTRWRRHQPPAPPLIGERVADEPAAGLAVGVLL